MRPVFTGEVYEVLPLNNGIVFSYCKDKTEKDVTVSYKMLSFDNARLTDITYDIYFLTKFGNNYRAIRPLCENYINAKAILLLNGNVFLMERSGNAALIDADSTPIWTGELSYRGYKATDIMLYKNVIWACYPDGNVLLRYNLSTMREEIRIGGNQSPFDRPVGLFCEGDSVLVSNKRSHKLIRLDLKNYTVFEEETFEEPLYQYLRVNDYRFVLLESGLYVI